MAGLVLPHVAAAWLTIDSKVLSDGGVAVGTLLAGLAAIYAARVGLATYKDSVGTSRARTLLDAETAFSRVMPILMIIESPSRYAEKIVPLLAKLESGPRLSDEEFELLSKLENGIRFFYIFVTYEKLHTKHKGILNAYAYYWRKMTDDQHSELRDYIKDYYESLWDYFAHQPVTSPFRSSPE